MKKSTLIVIAIIYIASIVVISVFGLKMVIYDQVIPVKSIECLNQTDDVATVEEFGGKKTIKIKYGEPGEIKDGIPVGTILQLEWRVLPDHVTYKDVRFEWPKELERVTFYKNNEGVENGLILFTGPVIFDLSIISTDGTRVTETITIWVS